MGVGALATYGGQPDYRGYQATGNRKVDEFYGGLSSAVEKSETEGKGKVLGLTTIPYDDMMSYGMSAMYSEASTEKDPIIRVSCNYGGERRVYDVHVNDVDPRNASQLEMFALCCYTDDKGITDGGTFGSFTKMKAAALSAVHNDLFADLQDPANAGGKFDWVTMLEKVAELYLGNPVVYDLYLDAVNLSAAMGKWSDEHSMNWEKSLFAEDDAETVRGKLVNMMDSETVSTRWQDLMPKVPREIAESIYNRFFHDGQHPYYDVEDINYPFITYDPAFSDLLSRISKQLDADGSRGSSTEEWNSALKAVKDMLSELTDFYGDKLLSDKERKAEVDKLKNLYQSIAEHVENARDKKIKETGAADVAGKEATDKDSNAEEDAEDDLRAIIREYIAEMYTKIINGDTEQKFPIGALSLTIKEWEKLLDEFDEIEDEIKTEIQEEINKIKAEQTAETEEKKTVDEAEFLTSEKVTKTVFREATEDKPEISYITCFTPDGIICKKAGKIEEAYLWKLDYKNEGDYEKVMAMLQSFPSDWNLRFASSEIFWKDYLEERIDKEDFISYMKTYTDKGNPNYLIEKNGSTYVNQDAIKYSKYLNMPEGGMYSPEEFTDMMARQIEENRRKLMEPNDSEAEAKLKMDIAAFKRMMLGPMYSQKTKHQNYYSANYTWRADNEDGLFRLYDKSGAMLGTFRYEDLVIKKDLNTGLEMLISEHGTASFYSAVPLDAEMKKTLSHILGTDEVPSENLTGYTIKTHSGTGLRYLVRDGEEGRGGRTLITSPADQAAYDRLVNEYMTKYPNLIKDANAAAIYADLEVRGLAGHTPNGILTMGWDSLAYRDNKDDKRNWGIAFHGNTKSYEIIRNWFEKYMAKLDDLEMLGSWEDAFHQLGAYERIMPREEGEEG